MTKHDLERLIASIRIPEDGITYNDTVAALEILLIKKAMDSQKEWNISELSRKLKMPRSLLWSKLNKYKMRFNF